MSTTHEVSKISDIIRAMRSGVSFYEDALEKVDDVFVKNAFLEMIRNKNAIIESLQPYAVAEQGEREEGSSVAVDSRKIYTKVANLFTSSAEHTFVDQLEEVEDKVLEVIDEALAEDQPAHTLMKLREIRVEAQLTHDKMKGLQEVVER